VVSLVFGGGYSSGKPCGERSFVRAFTRSAALSLLAVTAACGQLAPAALDQLRARGTLRVVSLNLPTCYYLGAQGTEGLEYELASAYAARLRVKLSMYTVADERAMRAELAAGRADIAAASLTNTAEWSRVGDAAAPYAHIPQLVVYPRSGVRPRDTLQLEAARIAVRAGSAQARILQRLKGTVAPALQWEETAPSSADPVEDVDSGEAQYAITDAREFSFAHHLYPNVLEGFALPEERPVQWIVRRAAPDLLASVDAFFRDPAASGRLAQLLQDSSGATRRFAYAESRAFQTHVADRLPRYRSWFEAAASQWSLDWRLLDGTGEGGIWHRGVQRLVRDLNGLTGTRPALHELDFEWAGFEWIDFMDADSSVVSFQRCAQRIGTNRISLRRSIRAAPISLARRLSGQPASSELRIGLDVHEMNALYAIQSEGGSVGVGIGGCFSQRGTRERSHYAEPSRVRGAR